jgi:hypothetical protein
MRGIRSSRELEDATRHRLDFIWFVEGRTVDHSTFAAFRVAFSQELKGLNREIGRLVCEQCASSLLEAVLDGTRLRANSDRHGPRSAQTLQKLIGACVAEMDRRLARMAEADAEGPDAAAQTEEIEQLRREVARLEAKRDGLEKALAAAQARDAVRQEHNGKNAPPVRVPVTDPDAQVTPNKEGGFAPNYTPVVAVDPVSRAVVMEDVLAGSDESAAVLPAVEAVETLSGKPLERVLADGNFASGPNLEALESRGTQACMPTGTDFSEQNPANRPDPSQPVAPADWDRLPKHGEHLAATAFVYDASQNCYWCPTGQPLHPVRSGHDRNGVSYTNYACPGSAGCPLAGRCVQAKASVRTVRRDQYQPLRETIGHRMATPEGRRIYARRAPIVEGVFAEIKHLMGIRRFLLRGLEKVRLEWTWICTAFNLKRLLARLVRTPNREPAPKGPTAKAHWPVATQLYHLVFRRIRQNPRTHPITPNASPWLDGHLSRLCATYTSCLP